LGGVTGDLLLKVPGFFLGGDPAGFMAFVTGTLFTLLTVGLLLHACGLAFQRTGTSSYAEDEDEEEEIPVRRSRRIVAQEPEYEEDDYEDLSLEEEEDDRPSRAAMVFGALQHVTLSAV